MLVCCPSLESSSASLTVFNVFSGFSLLNTQIQVETSTFIDVCLVVTSLLPEGASKLAPRNTES